METKQILLGKYSVGVGDRFGRQAMAQLQACIQALGQGVEIVPVWNKSNREHTIIGSEPMSVRLAADAAAKSLQWKLPYFVDADHISLKTVDRFLGACDFYTIDVADFIGQSALPVAIDAFVGHHPELLRAIALPGTDETFTLSSGALRAIAQKYLKAVASAGEVYRSIAAAKGEGHFITEISMDETDSPQTPIELLVILAAIAGEGIPVQTIAPKFSGRFNKGVDYVGNVAQFEREFARDAAAIAHAVRCYRLPSNLKLSVHSGSDKFSIYPAIHSVLKRFNAGVHLKTAGTTWLEEVIGLAEAGDDALSLAKEIYAQAFARRDELCAPYATVIDIDPDRLPSPDEVHNWSSQQYISALRHERANAAYNSSLRQLIHVGFKAAASMGSRYLDLVDARESIIAKNVTENLYRRHIAPVFLGREG